MGRTAWQLAVKSSHDGEFREDWVKLSPEGTLVVEERSEGCLTYDIFDERQHTRRLTMRSEACERLEAAFRVQRDGLVGAVIDMLRMSDGGLGDFMDFLECLGLSYAFEDVAEEMVTFRPWGRNRARNSKLSA